jgi:electron transport complex protein RnfG
MASPGDTAPRRGATAAAIAAASAVAVAVVALAYRIAAPRIEAHRHAEAVDRLTAVLGGLPFDNDPLTDVIEVRDPGLLGTDRPLPVHRVRLAGQPVAALIEVLAPRGYGGAIRLQVAVTPDGKVIGVRVLEHRETPGVGDRVEADRSDWLEQFMGRTLGNPPDSRWALRRDGGDYDQLSGATVTSRAVTVAVRDALAWYTQNRAQVFDAPPAATEVH